MITKWTLLCYVWLVYSVTLLPFHFWLWWAKVYYDELEWTLWKSSGKWLGNLFSFLMCHLSLFCSFLIVHSYAHRYQSSSSGCRPQACTEGAWRGHSSVAQPSRDESHNYSGHMDSKCNLSFSLLHFQKVLYIVITWDGLVCVFCYRSASFHIFDWAKLSHKVRIVDLNIGPFFEGRKVLPKATICFMFGNFRLFLAALKCLKWWLKSNWTSKSWKIVPLNHSELQKRC